MASNQITSYFRRVNDPNDNSDDEDLTWDPHGRRNDNAPPYVTNEDADPVDDPDDNDLENKDIRINNELKSLPAALDADKWLPKGKKRKPETQGGAPFQNSFFAILFYRSPNLSFPRASKNIY